MATAGTVADLVAEVSFVVGGDDLELAEVEVDRDLAAALGLTPGLKSELRLWTGSRGAPRQKTLVRARAVAEGNGFRLRIAPRLQRLLDARAGEPLFLARVKLEPCAQLSLRPAAPLPGCDPAAAAGYIANVLARDFTPVTKGSEIRIAFPGVGRPQAFTVESVEPFESRFTARTAIRMLDPIAATAPAVAAPAAARYADLGGLDPSLQALRELLEFSLRAPESLRRAGIPPCRGVLLFGPPGMGKALLVRAFAAETGVHLEAVSGAEALADGAGPALVAALDRASARAPAIILLDEVDLLAPRRDLPAVAPGATARLLALLDGLERRPGVVVVGTTSRLHAIDPLLRRPGRFSREVHVAPPDVAGRLEILRIHAGRMPLAPAAAAALPGLAARAHGFSAADLAHLCFDAGMSALVRAGALVAPGPSPARAPLGSLAVEAADLDQAFARAAPSALGEVRFSRPATRWSDIGGYDAVKERIAEAAILPLRRPEAFAAMRLKPPRGIVLHGPPGTGKTLFARAIAGECEANFLLLKGPEIFTRWVGESEERLRELFQVARQARPAILFIDEIDAMLPARGTGGQAGVADSVVNQFLAELDGVEAAEGVLVIGATNRLDRLDPAVLRPGRLGEHIEIGLPDLAARRAILRIHLAGVPVEGAIDRAIDDLAERSAGFSGALLVQVVDRAKYRAVRASEPGGGAPVLHAGWLGEELARLRPRAEP